MRRERERKSTHKQSETWNVVTRVTVFELEYEFLVEFENWIDNGMKQSLRWPTWSVKTTSGYVWSAACFVFCLKQVGGNKLAGSDLINQPLIWLAMHVRPALKWVEEKLQRRELYESEIGIWRDVSKPWRRVVVDLLLLPLFCCCSNKLLCPHLFRSCS